MDKTEHFQSVNAKPEMCYPRNVLDLVSTLGCFIAFTLKSQVGLGVIDDFVVDHDKLCQCLPATFI